MHRTSLLLVAGLLGACSPAGTFQGKLVNAMTHQPISGVRLLAKAPNASDLTCQVLEAHTDDNGVFTFENLCPNEKYNIEATDKTLVLVGVHDVAPSKELPASPQEVQAWRAPSGNGVFLLGSDKLKPLRTVSDVERAHVLGHEDEVVRYPSKLPDSVDRVKEGQYLVLAGQRAIEKMKFYPLIHSGKRKFAGDDGTMEPWWYLGVEFKSDTEFERVEAKPDASKVIALDEGDVHVRYVPADGMDPGYYGLMTEMDRRMYLVAFGPDEKPPWSD